MVTINLKTKKKSGHVEFPDMEIATIAYEGLKKAKENGITDDKQLSEISRNIKIMETYKALASGEFAIAGLDNKSLENICYSLQEGLPSTLSEEEKGKYNLIFQEVVNESTERVKHYITARNFDLPEGQDRDSFRLYEQPNEREKKLIANISQYSLDDMDTLKFLAQSLGTIYRQDDFLGKDEKMAETMDNFSINIMDDAKARTGLATFNKDRIESLAGDEATAAKKAKLEEKSSQKIRKKVTNWLYSKPTEKADDVYNRVYQESFNREALAIVTNPDYNPQKETGLQLAQTIDFLKNESKDMNAEQQIAYNKIRNVILQAANNEINRYMAYRNAGLNEDFAKPIETRNEEYDAKVLENINNFGTLGVDELAILARSLDTYYANSSEHARMSVIKQKITEDLDIRVKADAKAKEAEKATTVVLEDVNHNTQEEVATVVSEDVNHNTQEKATTVVSEDVNHNTQEKADMIDWGKIRVAADKAEKAAKPSKLSNFVGKLGSLVNKDKETSEEIIYRAYWDTIKLETYTALSSKNFDINNLKGGDLAIALNYLEGDLATIALNDEQKKAYQELRQDVLTKAKGDIANYMGERNQGLSELIDEPVGNRDERYDAKVLENIWHYGPEQVQELHMITEALKNYYSKDVEKASIYEEKLMRDSQIIAQAVKETTAENSGVRPVVLDMVNQEVATPVQEEVLEGFTINQENTPSIQPENVLSMETPVESVVENVVAEEAAPVEIAQENVVTEETAPVEIAQENVLNSHSENVEEMTDDREAILATIQQLENPEFNFEEISNDRLSELYQELYKAEEIKLSFTEEQQLDYYNAVVNMANASGVILEDYMKKRNDGLMVDGVQEKIDAPYTAERSSEYNDKIFENTKKEYSAGDMVTIANLAAFTKDACEILMIDDEAKYYDTILSKIQVDTEYRATLEQINEIAMFASLGELRVVNGDVDNNHINSVIDKVSEDYKERYKHELTDEDTKRVINNIDNLIEKSKQKGFPEELIDILAESPEGEKLNPQKVLEAYKDFIEDLEKYCVNDNSMESQGTVFSVEDNDNSLESQGMVFNVVEEDEVTPQIKKPIVTNDARPLDRNKPLHVPAPAKPLDLPISEFKPMKDEDDYKQEIRDAIKEVADKNKIALKEVPDEQNPHWMVLETFYSPKAIETGEKDGQIIYKGNNENGQSQVSTTNDFTTIFLAVKTAEKMGKTPIIFGKTNKKHSINLVLAAALVGAETKNAPDLESLKDNPQIALLIEKRALRKEMHELRTKLAEATDAAKKQEIQEKIEAKIQAGLKLQKEKGSIDVRKAKETPDQRMKEIKGRLEKAKGKDASEGMVKTERLQNFVKLNTTTR